MTDAEGLLITLSEYDQLDWNWTKVQDALFEIIENISDSGEIMQNLCFKAKISGDHMKQSTKNHVYAAKWTARLADMMFQIKK